jgi:hypothetical protein
MLQTSVEKMTTYIGMHYGNDAAQEWTRGVQTVLPEPVHLLFILAMHAERVKAIKDRLTLKLTSLKDERADIANEVNADLSNQDLKKELREIDDNISKSEIELKDEVEIKLTDDEKTEHKNAWRTHNDLTNRLRTSRGKVFSLLLGQCTQVLVDKMKQDSNWVKISTSSDPNLLLKLIEKVVLKQSDNQYRTAVLIAEQLSVLQFLQEDQVSNATY